MLYKEQAQKPEPKPDKSKPDLTDAEVDRLLDRYKQRRKAKKQAREAEQRAVNLIKSHYEPAETPKTWSDFF
eukprot:SAG31_NODE_4051_length_3635_cov_15.463670_2_plen_72_part_00